jgi:hypothetical protein
MVRADLNAEQVFPHLFPGKEIPRQGNIIPVFSHDPPSFTEFAASGSEVTKLPLQKIQKGEDKIHDCPIIPVAL